MNTKETWNIIILGIGGDLSRRKLLPALYSMVQKGKSIKITGGDIQPLTVDLLFELVAPFIQDFDEEGVRKFFQNIDCQKLDFTKSDDFKKCAGRFTSEDTYRLVYLAAASDYFCGITQHLFESGLVEKGNIYHRVVYEKPFGRDVDSARLINRCIESFLVPEQVYRIDHYLAKKFVSNILLLRCGDTIFNSLWNREHIDYMQVILNEELGIENRGAFYDAYGALKDVIQNHVLQIIALLTMKCVRFGIDAMSEHKAKVLRTLVVRDGILGQYEGYLEESGVAPGSRTETFAALTLEVQSPDWRGVPIYVQSGKYLERKLTEIRVVFKRAQPSFYGGPVTCAAHVLTIRVIPYEGFALGVDQATSGVFCGIGDIKAHFSYECVLGHDTPGAYEIIVCGVMAGDRSLTVSAEEIECQWSVIDAIKKLNLPLYSYVRSSAGPQDAPYFTGRGVKEE
jgi:glucose-6-phosphate 1-dehydrogenase